MFLLLSPCHHSLHRPTQTSHRSLNHQLSDFYCSHTVSTSLMTEVGSGGWNSSNRWEPSGNMTVRSIFKGRDAPSHKRIFSICHHHTITWPFALPQTCTQHTHLPDSVRRRGTQIFSEPAVHTVRYDTFENFVSKITFRTGKKQTKFTSPRYVMLRPGSRPFLYR